MNDFGEKGQGLDEESHFACSCVSSAVFLLFAHREVGQLVVLPLVLEPGHQHVAVVAVGRHAHDAAHVVGKVVGEQLC